MREEKEQFCIDLISLGLCKADADRLLRMIARMQSSYQWVTQGELFSVALEYGPKALKSFDRNGGSSLATWIRIVVRSKLRNYLRQEEQNRHRFTPTVEVGLELPYEAGQVLESEENLHRLSQMLSPMAWATVQIIIREHPKKISQMEIGRRLGLSQRSVSYLMQEVQQACNSFLVQV